MGLNGLCVLEGGVGVRVRVMFVGCGEGGGGGRSTLDLLEVGKGGESADILFGVGRGLVAYPPMPPRTTALA